MTSDDGFAAERQSMVDTQLRTRDIKEERVLSAMARVPREEFVPADLQYAAFADRPLPIGQSQTISQPYIVALMTQLARVNRESRVLDVGTGCGYQAAVLAKLAGHVWSIEINADLARDAERRLARLGYDNVTVRCGDGRNGWPEQSPFDAIIVAAAPSDVPPPLLEQLAVGGRLVIPVGGAFQELMLLEKHADGTISRTVVCAVAFVPLTGGDDRLADGASRIGF